MNQFINAFELQMLPHDQIDKASKLLRDDGIILYPTDSVWGLGCRFDSPVAYERLRKLKNRGKEQTFILLVASIHQLKQFCGLIHPRVETLLAHHQRPLTLIYPNPTDLPPHCLASDGSIAIRVVKDEFCQRLIKESGGPITSTSANLSGQPTPACFGEISDELITRVDFVFDYRRDQAECGEPSTMARFNKKGELRFIRN